MIGVIVFTSFFEQFLVFDLLSILYITVVNSDLGLRRLVGKQRSVALQKKIQNRSYLKNWKSHKTKVIYAKNERQINSNLSCIRSWETTKKSSYCIFFLYIWNFEINMKVSWGLDVKRPCVLNSHQILTNSNFATR